MQASRPNEYLNHYTRLVGKKMYFSLQVATEKVTTFRLLTQYCLSQPTNHRMQACMQVYLCMKIHCDTIALLHWFLVAPVYLGTHSLRKQVHLVLE